MTADELLEKVIARIKANPRTFKDMAKEIGLTSIKTLSSFVRGQSIPTFKNLVLIQNWIETH